MRVSLYICAMTHLWTVVALVSASCSLAFTPRAQLTEQVRRRNEILAEFALAVRRWSDRTRAEILTWDDVELDASKSEHALRLIAQALRTSDPNHEVRTSPGPTVAAGPGLS